MAADVERLKSLIHLADLIGETFPLTGSGRYRKTKEHDSLVVDTLKEEYWWNSHNEHGDAIDWAGRHRLNFGDSWNSHDPAMFKEAVIWLARWAGQPEPKFRPEDPQAREQRLSRDRLLALAADYYHELFLASQDAQNYAVNRGWTLETIKKACLGYSDGKLIDAIPEADHVLARDIGLLAEKDARWFDAIPAGCLVYVHHVRGRIAYLSGRSLQGKRHHNLYAQKEIYWAIPKGYGGPLVIVEGQPDAISIAQWGIASLGLCGVNLAALDPDAIALFGPIYLALDRDRAGEESLDRLVRGLKDPLMRIVEWPEVYMLGDSHKPAKDANDLLIAGATADNLQIWLHSADTYLALVLEQTKAADGADRDQFIQRMLELVTMLDAFQLTRYRTRICDELNMSRYDFDRLLAIAKNDASELGNFARGEEYVITPDNWTIMKMHNETGRITPVRLVNAAVRIVELLEHDNGSGDLFHEYQMDGELHTGRKLPSIAIPSADFAKMTWVAEKWPEVIVAAGRTTQDRLREAIQFFSGEIPRRRIYEHTGWREIDGRMIYLSSSGALGLGKDADFTVEVDLHMGRPETHMTRYDLPLEPKNIDTAILASLNFWDICDPAITVPQWAAVYLAPLAPLLTADFGLWVHGKSGSFKSVIAALALSHFGDWSGRDGRLKLPANFISTANNILMTAFQAKDTILVIDDYSPGNTPREMRERDEVASRLLRSLGNRAARGRMADGRRYQADFPPRCLALITAEDVPPGQSILARGIGVRVYMPPLGSEERATIIARISQAQEVESKLYRHAMAGYLLWVQRHWSELAEHLPLAAARHTKDIVATGHSRLADAFGKLSASVDTALVYFQDAGVLSEKQARDRQKIAAEALNRIIIEHAGQIEALDPCLILAETIQEQIDGLEWYLVPFEPVITPEGKEVIDDTPPSIGAKFIGWYDRQYIYLLPKAVKSVIDLYNRLGTPFPVGRNTLYSRLEERGWLIPGNDSTSVIHVPSANGKKRVLKLLKSALIPEE